MEAWRYIAWHAASCPWGLPGPWQKIEHSPWIGPLILWWHACLLCCDPVTVGGVHVHAHCLTQLKIQNVPLAHRALLLTLYMHSELPIMPMSQGICGFYVAWKNIYTPL